MFFDGITYSAIARNLSEGKGEFWNLFYTETIYPEFKEHPPLAIGMQSIFFLILGDHFFVERIYALICFILTAIGIGKVWTLYTVNGNKWVPILLTLTVPTFFWSFQNNLLENTLVLFTTFSVLFYVNGIKHNKWYSTMLGSLFCILAFLSKGPVGLFPLIVPLAFYIFVDRKALVLKHSAIQVLTLAFIAGLIISIWKDAFQSITDYLDHQVFAALKNKREITVNNRFKIILDLILMLAIPLGLAIFCLLKTKAKDLMQHKYTYFLLFIAFSASFPLLLSLKQSAFYLVPSIPFFCLAIGTLVEVKLTQASTWMSTWRYSRYICVSIIAAATLLMIFNYGHISRDKELLSCVLKKTNSSTYSTLEANSGECYNWTLVAYSMRLRRTSLTCNEVDDFYCKK